MKNMKTADLRAKTADELAKDLLELRKEQFNLRFQKTSGQLAAPTRVRAVRRDIARIKTVLNEQNSGVTVAAKVKAPKKAAKPAAAKKKKEETKE